ncbi:hypothetical protein HXX01_00740 [Candidatus Nomurabacteria bacterium]|nr:hypothetical protein [Candidatus Nomurabacteria bacterium]
MNYRTVESLQGRTLCVGDLVGICAIGHLIKENNLENLGGCGDLWIFEQLGIDLDKAYSFCLNISHEVWIDFGDETICFESLESLTLVVLELMKLSEEQGYNNFEE